ncbi:MAG: DUF6580 family putative transport protein [Patescibacteria group bacterium]
MTNKSKNSNLKFQTIYTIFLIVAGALARLIPHPPNFTPIGSIALFGGRELPKKFSFVIPIIALALSDIIIGFYDWKILASVYLSFIISVSLGQKLKRNFSALKLLYFSVSSSTIFFLLTNLAVWAFSPMYPHSLSGLGLCYWYALPFFRNELTATIFYATIIFGADEFIKIILRRKKYAGKISN